MTPDEAMQAAAAHFSAGRHDDAQAMAHAILQAIPRHFYALHLLATIAALRGQAEDAIDFSSRALAIDPGHAEALVNRGAALRMANRFEEALADYDRALRLAPRFVAAHSNRGVALAALNRYPEAVESYTRALELDPGHLRSRFNRGLAYLVQGDFEHAWADHEARWGGSDTLGAARNFGVPQWTGREELQGKTVLLHAEQGLGDTIQFVRYLPLVLARGARVVLEVHAALVPLFQQFEGVHALVARGDALPGIDLHCPLMSLPLAFGTRVETIPAAIPYLRAPEDSVSAWRERLGERKAYRVGLAWSGSTTLRNDRNRTLPFSQLASILVPGIEFVSVQKEVREPDRAALGAAANVRHFGEALADFRDTAALVSQLDLVISVDTAVAHLAGAMGKPVWVLLPHAPDWRWMLEREDSPWYPSARLIRQPRTEDWASVMERVRGELAKR
ncbi:hypothetical protein BWI17_07905 [Betaproteobacteria bacterium GR16-43]|nr:hypothetical protein BWI17_07905 [Betaproteobacteria bacterium GR16-43]